MLEVQDLDREDQPAVAAVAAVAVVADVGESVDVGEAVEQCVSCAKDVGKGPVDLMWKQRPVRW